jgi:hypothetical protein
MYRGDTHPIRDTITDADGGAINLSSGYKFNVTGKRSPSDAYASAVFSFNSTDNASQFDTSDLATGIIEFTIINANTSSLTSKTTLLCDLQVRKTSDNSLISSKKFLLVVDMDVSDTIA